MPEEDKAKEIRGENTRNEEYPCKEITEKIIGCAIRVHRALGPGYLESIYENAMGHELAKNGLRFTRQHTVKVLYDGIEVGEHRADIFVEGQVVVELKSVDMLTPKHEAQVISTLKAVKAQVGLLLNFDEVRLVNGVRRLILTQYASPSRPAS